MTRKFSTDDLENLTEGTTPGPWESENAGWIDGPNYATVLCPSSQVECRSYCYGGTSLIEGDNLETDTRLMAAAPELANELHRVRTELEALRDHARDIRGHESTAEDITRILNGDTNE